MGESEGTSRVHWIIESNIRGGGGGIGKASTDVLKIGTINLNRTLK